MFDIDKFMTKPFIDNEHGPGCPPPPFSRPPFPEKPRYTMTEEVEHTARLMRETIDRLLKFEQRVKDDIDTLSKNVMSDNVIFKNTMHEAWTTFLMEVKNEINVFEGNIEADIRLFKSEVETDYANLSEDCRNQIAENLATYEQKVADYEAKYETEWAAFKTSYEQAFTELRTSIQAQYNAFVNAVNSRIDEHNESCAQAFADYQRKLNTELNSFENTINTNYATFTESMGNSMHEFRTSLETTVNERLANQDGKISDAESYMKTNLEATVTTVIGDMHANGDFAEIIEGEVFNDLQRKVDGFGRMSILYFGAVADGETDCYDAFTLAYQHARATKKAIFVPRGTYYLSAPLNIETGFEICGDYQKTIIKTVNGFIKAAKSVKDLYVHDMNIEGGARGIELVSDDNASGFPNCVLENLNVSGATEWGIFLDNAWDIVLSNIHVSGNANGLRVSEGNSISLENIVAFQNNGYGVFITNSANPVFKGTVQENKNVGLYIDTVLGGNITVYGEQNGYAQTENTHKADVFIHDSSSLTINAYTNGGNSGTTNMKNNYGIYADYMTCSVVSGRFVHHAISPIYFTTNCVENELHSLEKGNFTKCGVSSDMNAKIISGSVTTDESGVANLSFNNLFADESIPVVVAQIKTASESPLHVSVFDVTSNSATVKVIDATGEVRNGVTVAYIAFGEAKVY